MIDENRASNIEEAHRQREDVTNTSRRLLRYVAFRGGNMRRPYDGYAFSNVRFETGSMILSSR
jgi:hypothetical protein